MAGTIPQEIDRINTEVATQAAKIAQLSTILDGKAGGGGGSGAPQTIQITIIKSSTNDAYGVVYCTYENDTYTTKTLFMSEDRGDEYVINCLVGGSVYISDYEYNCIVPTASDNIEITNTTVDMNYGDTHTWCYFALIKSGTTGTITI